MKRLLGLLAAICLAATAAHGQELGNYPNATTPLSGNERLIADQAGSTVNITPAMLENFTFPGGTLAVTLGGTGANSLMGPMCGNGTAAVGSCSATNIAALWASVSGSCYLRGDGNCVTPSGAGTVTSSGSPVANNIAAFTTSTNIAPAVAANIIALWGGSCSSSTYLGGDGNCYTASGSGTVTSIGLTLPAWLSVTPGTITSSGTFAVTSTSLAQGLFIASPAAATGALSARAILASDLPQISLFTGVTGTLGIGNGGTGNTTPFTGLVVSNGSSPYGPATFSNVTALWGGGCTASTFLRGDGNCVAAGGGGGGAVSSVALTMPTYFSVSGSPVTSSGTLAVTQTAPVPPNLGGTGNNNGTSAISLGGNLTTTGGAVTVGALGSTTVTLPAAGTFTAGYLDCLPNTQSTAYTTQLSDRGKCVFSNAQPSTPAPVQSIANHTTGGVSSQTVTFGSSQTAGNTNAVAIGWCNSTSTVSAIVDSQTNSYSIAAPLTTISGTASSVIYYAPNIRSGSNTITVTFSGSTPCSDVRAAEYSGILTVAPFDVQASATSTTGTALNSGNATTTTPAELLVGSLYGLNGPTTQGSGWTARVTSSGSNLLEDQIVSSVGTYAATGTQGSSGWWIAQMATFKAAGQSNTYTINSALAYPTGSTIAFINCAVCSTLNIAISGGATLYLTGASPVTSGPRQIVPSGQGVATLWPDGNWYINGPGTE